jgi:hypothetical protein
MMNKRLAAMAIGAGVAAYVAWKWVRGRRSAVSSGMADEHHDADRDADRDPVLEASEDSFPASDPPAYTVIRGPMAR